VAMTEDCKLWKFSEIPLGLKVIGLFNIILGLFLSYVFLFIFMVWGLFCCVARSNFHSLQDLLFFIIIIRLIMVVFYFSLFLLVISGIDIFTGNSRAKKMILISAPVIVLLLAYKRFPYISNVPTLVLAGYLIASLVYIFCNSNAVRFFSNKGTKLKLIMPLSIFLLFYLLGFWIGWKCYSW
jgi:hypothetical protein